MGAYASTSTSSASASSYQDEKKESEQCTIVRDIWTLKDLYMRFEKDSDSLFGAKSSSDVACAYYLAHVTYSKLLLDCGLFSKTLSDTRARVYEKVKGKTPLVLVIEKGGELAISIRGTFVAADECIDLRMSLLCVRVPKVLAGMVDKARVKELSLTMHTGILLHALKSLALIKDVVSSFPRDKAVRIYGHSLGAASAVVMAHVLIEHMGFSNVACYPISCPSVFKPDCPVLKSSFVDYMHRYSQHDIIVEKTGVLGKFKVVGKPKDYFKECVLYGPPEKNVCLPIPGMTSDDGQDKQIDLRPHGLLYAKSDLIDPNGSKKLFIKYNFEILTASQ